MRPRITLADLRFFSRPTRTRFPFRYGIASMTEVPHLIVEARLAVDEIQTTGLASEGLPPKWFTKNPATTFEEDLPEMLEVIGHAAGIVREAAARPIGFFELWRELSGQQTAWAKTRSCPPLLANLGVSLLERVLLDGLCRALRQPLHQVVRENLLGLDLGEIHHELRDAEPRSLLPAAPLASVRVRHTIGLGDPLTAAEIPEGDRVEDGLPQDLESCIRAYGLRAFKIKLCGDADLDLARLRDLHRILDSSTGGDFIATLDGNENFKDFGAFRDFWERAAGHPALSGLLQRIVVIEQPVHRAFALDESAAAELRRWHGHPPLIIDESDAETGDLPRALALGYDGTSHKNCKGIVKGLANACLIAARRRRGDRAVLTGEDLANLGPIALLQDLAMMSLLGVEHVERNGHHYFRGLSLWPESWQEAARAAHPDLFVRDPHGFVRVQIQEGRLSLRSINEAPFGLGANLDAATGGAPHTIIQQ